MNTNFQKTLDAREKVRAEKVKKAQDFAKKTINSVENTRDEILERAEAVKQTVVHVSQQADRDMLKAYDKAGDLKKDIKHGAKQISKDMHRVVVRVSKDLHD